MTLNEFINNPPRTVIAAGHYGSGKTNVAVNLALEFAARGYKTAAADLDIVNPYFRAADNAAILKDAGVRVIVPEFANSNVDIPALPPDVITLFEPDETHNSVSVVDVGGDEGAVALGMYRRQIEAAGYAMIYVVNMYRPLIAEVNDAVALMNEISFAARLPFTAVVNNSNLGCETDESVVMASLGYADAISKATGLPLLFTSAFGNYVPGAHKNGWFEMRDVTKKLF